MVFSDQKFSRYFHEKTGVRWHASGDLGEIDEKGNLILRGRKKEMIIRRNMNIYPALYENTIKNIKGIEEAALVGIYDEEMQDEKIYLAVEGRDLNMRLIQHELHHGRYCIDREALPDFIFSMTIPLKGRQNKIDRLSIVNYIKKHVL
jgi:acyl-CoA synthetase (AMP-forming)/AMP-acid ligase II